MRTRKMRLVSALLAVAMMFVMMPVGAFADDSDPMGTLIEGNNTTAISIDKPGTYQMKGPYGAPVIVKCGGVTINITGDIDYTGSYNSFKWRNYVIRIGDDQNENSSSAGIPGIVTINNNGYTVHIKGDSERNGVLFVSGVCHVVVNNGYYVAEDTVMGKELFYNYGGTMELNNVHATGEMLIKNNKGTAIVNGGVFERTHVTIPATKSYSHGAIINTQDGTLTLNNVEVSAEQGSALINLGGKITITGGSYTTKDTERSAILVEADHGQYNSKADNINTDGPSAIGSFVEIDGATIKDSARGIEAAKNEPNLPNKIALKDATFENNGSDIYLNLNDNQNADEVLDVTNYDGKPLTAKVTTADGKGDTTLAVKPADLTVEGGTVKVDTSSIVGEATVNKDGDTTKASVPVKALVTVTYDEAAYADSNLKFNGWTITGLANAEDYKNQQTFTFEMPANTVTIKAGTATTDTEDDSWDAATVITGVAIGAGAAVLTYHIGTELYAEQVLGKGVAIPRTREDVALKAWELAGKPAVELNGEPLSEAAQAEKWAVESGLMQNDAQGNFNGTKKMNKLKALRVLDKAQKLNAQ